MHRHTLESVKCFPLHKSLKKRRNKISDLISYKYRFMITLTIAILPAMSIQFSYKTKCLLQRFKCNIVFICGISRPSFKFHVLALPQYLQYRLQEYLQANRIPFQNQNICSIMPVPQSRWNNTSSITLALSIRLLLVFEKRLEMYPSPNRLKSEIEYPLFYAYKMQLYINTSTI